MWNAKITTIAPEPDQEQLIAEAKGLPIRELENWLNLQVPSLQFIKLRNKTIKAKGLDVELDEVYHVQAVKVGEKPTLTTERINTVVDEEEALLAEEAEEAEAGEPNIVPTLGFNLSQTTADQAVKQIAQLDNPSQLEALLAEEESSKRRSTVINAIKERLEDLQTQP